MPGYHDFMQDDREAGHRPNAPTRQVSRGLLEDWRHAQHDLESFLDSVGADSGAHAVAVWVQPQAITSPEAWTDHLSSKVADDGLWKFVTSTYEDGKQFGFALPVTLARADDPCAFLLVDVHSLMGTWWLMCAWRARELARATSLLADNWDSVAAAACARPLVETAAATWVDAQRLARAWGEMKLGGAPSKSSGSFFVHWRNLHLLLQEVHHGAKFDDRAPEEKATWGKTSRSNVLGQVEKLGNAGCPHLQSDYQWLCNTVHPSVGNKLAYTSPPLRHETGTHTIQHYCGRPTSIRESDGSVVADQTVGIATARGVTVAMRTLRNTLDAALRVIDDLGLTSGAPALAREKVWRRIQALGQNDPCPCRSGLKVKKCRHQWGGSAPAIPQRFCDGNLPPPSLAGGLQ